MNRLGFLTWRTFWPWKWTRRAFEALLKMTVFKLDKFIIFKCDVTVPRDISKNRLDCLYDRVLENAKNLPPLFIGLYSVLAAIHNSVLYLIILMLLSSQVFSWHQNLDTMQSLGSTIRLTSLSVLRTEILHVICVCGETTLCFTPVRLGPIFESYIFVLERHELFTRYSQWPHAATVNVYLQCTTPPRFRCRWNVDCLRCWIAL